MVARGLLVALGSAAVVAASQSLGADASSTSTIFQQSFRGRFPNGYIRSGEPVANLKDITDEAKSCIDQINQLRHEVGFKDDSDSNYVEIDPTGVTNFKDKIKTLPIKCDDVASGSFTHINGDLFVFSLPGAGGKGAEATCTGLREHLKTGFDQFENNYPPKFKDFQAAEPDNVYKKSYTVGFISMILEKTQKIYCGFPDSCTEEQNQSLVCVLSESKIKDDDFLVSATTWRSVMKAMQVPLPTVEADSENKYLSEMNNLRKDTGLALEEYTVSTPKVVSPQVPSVEVVESEEEETDPGHVSALSSREHGETFDDQFELMTCDDLKDIRIFQRSSDKFTFIAATAEGENPPTPKEAIEFWMGGFQKLNGLPPAFTGKFKDDEAIYKNNDVIGFVSLMADTPRKVTCKTLTGCDGRSAVVCALEAPTLVSSSGPISAKTWEKLQRYMHVKPTLAALGAENEIVKAINTYRTQESLALAELTAPKEAVQSNLLKAVTCSALEKSTVAVTEKEGKSSLMYFVTANASTAPTGAAGVAALSHARGGLGNNLPAEYKASGELAYTAAAANFVSLVSDQATNIDCYTATGCSKQAVICQLSPPALVEGRAPLKPETWTKVVATQPSGASSSLSIFGLVLALCAALPLI